MQLPDDFNAELLKDINYLIEYILSKKEFVFEEKSLDFNYSLLITSNILNFESHYLVIKKYDVIVISLFNYFSKSYSYIPDDNIENLFIFLEKCRTDLNGGRNVTGKYEFIEKYYEIILKNLNRSFKYDFVSFIKNYDSTGDTRGFIIFLEAFFKLLSKFELKNEEIIEISKKVNSLSHWNNIISDGIRNLTLKDKIKGKELLDFSISINSPVPAIDIAILQVLYCQDRKNLDLIKDLVANEEKHILVLKVIIPLIVKDNEQDFEEFIKIAETIESKKSTDSLLIIPNVYLNLINNTNEDNHSQLKVYFDQLYKFSLLEDQNIVRSTIIAIQRIDGHEARVKNLTIMYLKSGAFNIDLVPEIANIFNYHKSVIHFFEFLIEFANYKKFPFKMEEYEYVIDNLRKTDTKVFDSELIKLLINNKGEVRFIGCQILAHLTTSNPLNFEFDILSLEPLSQYKFLLSTLHVLFDPLTLLPLLLPLVKSTNEFVREAFICKVEELTSSGYGKEIIEVLTLKLNSDIPEEVNILERVRKYYINHSKEFDERIKIKELDPYFIQAKLLDKFNNIYQRSLRKTVSEGVKSKSVIRQLATNITLAKGGGWKHEDQEEIKPLGRFQSSFTMPKIMFIYPELIDWERHLFVSENWENEFEGLMRFF